MAFANCITLSLIFLSSFCFLSTWTLARPQSHSAEIVVDLVNSLPRDTQVPLQLSCEGPSSDLKLGNHFSRTVKVGQGLECTAQWLPWFTTWDAYDAKRDKGHATVYWEVKEDGFYLSWDQSEWKKVERWYTD